MQLTTSQLHRSTSADVDSVMPEGCLASKRCCGTWRDADQDDEEVLVLTASRERLGPAPPLLLTKHSYSHRESWQMVANGQSQHSCQLLPVIMTVHKAIAELSRNCARSPSGIPPGCSRVFAESAVAASNHFSLQCVRASHRARQICWGGPGPFAPHAPLKPDHTGGNTTHPARSKPEAPGRPSLSYRRPSGNNSSVFPSG